jgi:glycine betaine catabolism B
LITPNKKPSTSGPFGSARKSLWSILPGNTLSCTYLTKIQMTEAKSAGSRCLALLAASITTKHSEPSSTFKNALFALQPGATVDLAEAMGDFVLPKDASRPLVFVAGGIGLTPFHSIVSWLNNQGEKRDIKFLYSVRNESEIIFQDTFDAAEIVPTIVVTEPSNTWTGKMGRLTAEMILGLEKPAENALVYVSGPEPMTEALEAQLKAAGLRDDQLVLDFFPNYANDYAS